MKHLEIAHETLCKNWEFFYGKEQRKVKKQLKNELISRKVLVMQMSSLV